MIFLIAFDYGSKVFAQTYLSVNYEAYLIDIENNTDRFITLCFLFISFLFFQLTRELFLKLREVSEWGQNLLTAFVICSVMDCYLYPGSLKWIWSFSFSDLYLFLSGLFTLVLCYNYYKRFTGKI